MIKWWLVRGCTVWEVITTIIITLIEVLWQCYIYSKFFLIQIWFNKGKYGQGMGNYLRKADTYNNDCERLMVWNECHLYYEVMSRWIEVRVGLDYVKIETCLALWLSGLRVSYGSKLLIGILDLKSRYDSTFCSYEVFSIGVQYFLSCAWTLMWIWLHEHYNLSDFRGNLEVYEFVDLESWDKSWKLAPSIQNVT